MHFEFDLDGTICFKGQPISEPLLQSLEKLIHKGHGCMMANLSMDFNFAAGVIAYRFEGVDS